VFPLSITQTKVLPISLSGENLDSCSESGVKSLVVPICSAQRLVELGSSAVIMAEQHST
jgi:hypothetical protein